ncbi:MAG: hypothetical protein KDK91_11645 [Gammaproteobacteria bacterium]|nr:hypothetical protein [Gammaproteobacteria bacterium]
MQTLSEEPNRGRPSRPGVLVRWVRLMVQSRSLFCSVLLGSVLLVGVARAGEVHTGSFTISADALGTPAVTHIYEVSSSFYEALHGPPRERDWLNGEEVTLQADTLLGFDMRDAHRERYLSRVLARKVTGGLRVQTSFGWFEVDIGSASFYIEDMPEGVGRHDALGFDLAGRVVAASPPLLAILDGDFSLGVFGEYDSAYFEHYAGSLDQAALTGLWFADFELRSAPDDPLHIAAAGSDQRLLPVSALANRFLMTLRTEDLLIAASGAPVPVPIPASWLLLGCALALSRARHRVA